MFFRSNDFYNVPNTNITVRSGHYHLSFISKNEFRADVLCTDFEAAFKKYTLAGYELFDGIHFVAIGGDLTGFQINPKTKRHKLIRGREVVISNCFFHLRRAVEGRFFNVEK